MDRIHENQVGEILPYQFEPEPSTKTSDASDDSDTDQSDVIQPHLTRMSTTSLKEQMQRRLLDLSWCKCGHCSLSTKAVECFCCHEKALEYDENEVLLDQAELQGEKCLTAHSDFKDNMLSESVLKIDVCQYLEENYPLDDEDLERMHKLYRIVAYRRCSRWVFQILGKKNRRPFPACVYSKIRERFASTDGLYTHFKYAKRSKR